MEYPFQEIEPRWQQRWKEQQTYRAEVDIDRQKYYVLDMFPYPSGAGLHVGHPLGYIATDILSRSKRMKGFNVLHPMGFDAFGLPAEQYAIETGQHPAITTQQNIKRYKQQLERIGFDYDWSREIQTCSPDYYKWTQWIFTRLFHSWYNRAANQAQPIADLVTIFSLEGNAVIDAATSFKDIFSAEEWNAMDEKVQQEILLEYRLAYLAWAEVNWCPALGTVLANDEVKDGKSERGGHPVYRKRMRQWFLRITAYAERLLEGLERIDWPESLKEMQRNWIGRSEGATIYFPLEGRNESLEIFTTRPDTIFGATYMVLAPEHPLVDGLTKPMQRFAMEQYQNYVRSRSDVERLQEKMVTGCFTGSFALHPFTGERLPIWVSEYVLIGYGSGAIMAVPCDDERDNAFAIKFGLPIVDVIDRDAYPNAKMEEKVGHLINSSFLNGMEVKDAIAHILSEIKVRGLGQRKVNFKLRDAGFSRQRYWGEPFPVVFRDDLPYTIGFNELPLTLPDIESFKPTEEGEAPLARNQAWVHTAEGDRETDTMPGYAGSSWYFLRFMDPHNTGEFANHTAVNYWEEVDFYIGGAEHAVGHLMYARFWHKFLYDLGHVPSEEPFRRLINQGMIQGRSSIVYRVEGTNKFVSRGLKDIYVATPLRVDIGLVKNDILDIPRFRQWRDEYRDAEFILEDGKYLCGYEIEKMSKRWHNVVNPDEVIDEYGADTFRMYEMFLGPLEVHKPWDTQGIDGVHKFLRKFWRLFSDRGEWLVTEDEATPQELKVLHTAIRKVNDDIGRLAFNTAVSAFMVCVNELHTLNCHKLAILEPLNRLLAPFAPHITEELNHRLGFEGSVHHSAYPVADEAYLKEESFEYPVSINGKVRTKLTFALDRKPTDMEPEVLADATVQKWLEGQAPKKVIIVPGRIINVVK